MTDFTCAKTIFGEELLFILLRLGVTVGYNSSDLTFGWNGYMEGFTVFYLHHTDSLPNMKRSFQLTADIMVREML